MTIHHGFYDTETTGPNPSYDQILQLAGVLTDDDFNIVDMIDIRSRMCSHVVPTPGALKVTGTNPNEINNAPYNYFEFAEKCHAKFSGWKTHSQKTTFSGFNTISFDEEIIRQMYWQNLLDPYISSGPNTYRNDLFTLIRCLYARNPNCFHVPKAEDGRNSFRLEKLAYANGFTEFTSHDAYGDVHATIFLARLIRDTDPSLWEHMLDMGNANDATEFVDNNPVFQLLGVPMLDPGILDVCYITTDKSNKRNKLAWNLAIDPEPYFTKTPKELLDLMQTKGTPFRSVKCNKQPPAFTTAWQFNHRARDDHFEPVDTKTIEQRSNLIFNNHEFQNSVQIAMELKQNSYENGQHIEDQIYASGFPSKKDKERMKKFHASSDWNERLAISDNFEKPELRQISIRIAYNHSRSTLTQEMVDVCDRNIAKNRYSLIFDKPWNTVGKFMVELDELLEQNPDDNDLLVIKNWVLKTYPAAKYWVPIALRDPAQPELTNIEIPQSLALNLPNGQNYLDGIR